MTIQDAIAKVIADWKCEDTQSVREINNGSCEEFAQLVCDMVIGARPMWDEELDFRFQAHCFIVYRGRFYDAEAPDGRTNWRELPFYMQQSRSICYSCQRHEAYAGPLLDMICIECERAAEAADKLTRHTRGDSLNDKLAAAGIHNVEIVTMK